MPEVVRRSLAHASAPTRTTIFPRCAFSRIIWCGSGHCSNGNVRESTGRILRSAISWLARIGLVGVGEVRADDRLLAHPQVAHVERQREARRRPAGHDLAERAAHEHAREERGRADVLEDDVAVDAAGGLADRLAEALDLVEVRLAVVVREGVVAPVDDRVRPQAAAEIGLVLARDDRDRIRAVEPAELDRHRAEPAARAPHEHVVAGLQGGLVDEHAVGGEVDEAVRRRLGPGQVRRLGQQLLRLHLAVVGERAPVGLVGPDLLLRAGHRVEAVALRALAAALVAVHDDLVAGLPARHARARPRRRSPRRPSRRCGSRTRCSGRPRPAGRGRPRRCCSSRRRP